MKKQLFHMPIDISSYVFDARGRSVPSRANWHGKTYAVSQLENSNMVSIYVKGSYFWLEKDGLSWRFINFAIA